jgi:hypothetical protein
MLAADLHLAQAALFDRDRPSPEATAALLLHPRFPEAARMVAEGLVALYRDHHEMNAVLADRVRYIVGVFAIHLHLAGDPDDPQSGLTASRLRRLCVARKVCSAGRADATLADMRAAGHITAAPDDRDRRLRRLAPAAPLLDWHRQRCVYFLGASAKVMAEGLAARAALDAPRFMSHFMAELAATHVAGFHYVEHIPHIGVFYDRNAGGPILMQLLLSGSRRERFPPARPVPVSISALARAFKVSRAHVRRVLGDAAQAGLLDLAGSHEDRCRASDDLLASVRQALATYMLHYTHCASLARLRMAAG